MCASGMGVKTVFSCIFCNFFSVCVFVGLVKTKEYLQFFDVYLYVNITVYYAV